MIFKKYVNVLMFVVLAFVSVSSYAYTSPIDDNKFSSDDVVTLYGEVSVDSANKIIAQLQKTAQGPDTKPVLFFINSPGGDVFQGTRIVDAMLASKRPIYTIDIGMAASMAAYIHSYGTQRLMLPHAVLMYHNASSSYSGDVNHLKNEIIMLMSMMNDLNKNVSDRSGVPLDELTTKENTEWWVLSGEAQERHFVDKVINTMDYPIPPGEEPKKDLLDYLKNK